MSKSFPIALGGLITAVSLLLMFMTGFVPFGEFVLPTLAGIILIACVCELGTKPALLVYLASALLSIIVCPVKESAMLYTMFLGYYPVIRPKLHAIRPGILRIFLKFALFNVAIFLSYFLLSKLFGIASFDISTPVLKTLFVSTVILANLFFASFDVSVGVGYLFYVNVFRKKYLKRGH